MMVGFDTERVGVEEGASQTLPNWWTVSTVMRNGWRTSTVADPSIGVASDLQSTLDDTCKDCWWPVSVASDLETAWLFE